MLPFGLERTDRSVDHAPGKQLEVAKRLHREVYQLLAAHLFQFATHATRIVARLPVVKDAGRAGVALTGLSGLVAGKK